MRFVEDAWDAIATFLGKKVAPKTFNKIRNRK